jgi:hypothetical protein
MARMTWNGDRLVAKAEAASVLGVDATMAACVSDAKRDHEWKNVTGFEEGSIGLIDPAFVKVDKVQGRWGAEANTSLWLEIGTSREDSGAPRAEVRAQAAGGNMSAVTPPQPADDPLMIPRPYLRPAADRQYPLLRVRIGAAMRGARMP